MDNTKFKTRYLAVYHYSNGNVKTGKPRKTVAQAQEDIEDMHYSTHGPVSYKYYEDAFDYCEIKTIYVPLEYGHDPDEDEEDED
ncbi:hypothetical protein LIS04_122 [Listeria phage LIS04]|nr:hypothetical protein LIS04_122 [Listeria phage LIS04]